MARIVITGAASAVALIDLNRKLAQTPAEKFADQVRHPITVEVKLPVAGKTGPP
ncbi:MAG: hypothetical protein GX575_24840 [Candidatus Anammoximicrobium sp.]|nr:hypothetical protein [Candidatus Anammoximicrobium sp.]